MYKLMFRESNSPTSLMFSFTSNVVNSYVVVVSGNGGLVSYALLVHASLFPEIYDLTSDWFPRCRENKLYTAYTRPAHSLSIT